MLSTNSRKAWSCLFMALAALLIMGWATVPMATAADNNLLQNGSFSGNLDGWIVNTAHQTGTTPWTPLLGDGSGVTLHPDSYSFRGTVLYQNLNVTGIAGKPVTIQARLWQLSSPPYQNTVAFYLTYVDTANAFHRVKAFNPLNSSISLDSTASPVSVSYTFADAASKLVKLEIAKEADGEFHMDDVVLSADGVTIGLTPAVSGVAEGTVPHPLPADGICNICHTGGSAPVLSATSGAYGTTLAITGSNFGGTTGKVTLGGVPVTINSWTDAVISVTPVSPARSGSIIVIAGGVESNPSQPFQVTSPYFNVELVTYGAKVIQGQQAEFLFKSTFLNGFTTTDGIGLQLRGDAASTLSGKAAFTLVPIKSAGGALLRIDTTGLPAATYTADIVAVNGSEIVPVGTLNLQVVTVSNIKFYEMIYDPVTYVSSRVDLTSKTVSLQDQLLIYTEVIGSDDLVFSGELGESGVILSEVPASGNYPILGIYKRFWGPDLYAQANGSTTLRAMTPDGTFFDLSVMVNFPSGATDSYISGIGLTAPEGAPPINPIYNNRTAPIIWYASGTTRLGLIGYDTAGMMNFQNDFFDKLNRSQDGLSASSTFTLQNLPTDIGTALLYASTNDGKAKAVIPLTTVNAPGTGLLSFYIKSLDPNAFAEIFKIYFYGASDNQLKFTRDVYAMHIGNKPVLVGNIPPGSYKILFTPGSTSVKPQWWPNASDISGASSVVFAAGATVGDVYFFVGSQATDTAVTLPTPASHDFTSVQAGSGSISFTAGDGYVWNAASSAPWITITSGVTGIGSGTVTYTVAANPYSYPRTGTITIGGQSYTITQPGTGVVPRHIGTWGAQQLIHFDQVGGVSVPWYAEVSRTTLNEDGTGTMVIKKNDHNGELIDQTKNLTYSMASSLDGSLAMTITMDGQSMTERLVIGDGGRMGIVDGTGREGQQKLMVLYRIDTAKMYSVADMNGEYYNVGFERNMTDVADPPLYGNGAFMAISGVTTFKGNGLYDYYGKANSVKIDGSNLIWDDSGKTNQSYSVSADGTITVGGGAFQGWLTGNGLAAGGGAVFQNGVNNQVGYFFLKKGDRAYTTANLAGKWAFVSFGQDSKTTSPTSQGFNASIGTMICDAAGKCTVKLKGRLSDDTTPISTDHLTLSVAADGSFGASLDGRSPAYAGVIGNNGNTIMLNPSFEYSTTEDPYHREIVIGIRANNIGDLAGGTAFLKGDVNGDDKVDLADAILALKFVAGITPTTGTGIRSDYTTSGADVNDDGMVGASEIVYILQRVAGLRP